VWEEEAELVARKLLIVIAAGVAAEVARLAWAEWSLSRAVEPAPPYGPNPGC
jgi:hypothetical protein